MDGPLGPNPYRGHPSTLWIEWVAFCDSALKLIMDKVHWPVFVSDYKDVFDELKRQQAKGRIRYYSVCNFGPQNMKDAFAAGGQPITNQVS